MFLSGQVGSRPDSSPEPEPEAPVRQAFATLNAIALAAGHTFDNVATLPFSSSIPERTASLQGTLSQGRVVSNGKGRVVSADRVLLHGSPGLQCLQTQTGAPGTKHNGFSDLRSEQQRDNLVSKSSQQVISICGM